MGHLLLCLQGGPNEGIAWGPGDGVTSGVIPATGGKYYSSSQATYYRGRPDGNGRINVDNPPDTLTIGYYKFIPDTQEAASAKTQG